jgi:hypothetical protein
MNLEVTRHCIGLSKMNSKFMSYVNWVFGISKLERIPRFSKFGESVISAHIFSS